MNWHKHFDKRQLDEIKFSNIYATDFQHGTDGHNANLIIAVMAKILNDIENILLSEDNPNKPHWKTWRIEEILRITENMQGPTENSGL